MSLQIEIAKTPPAKIWKTVLQTGDTRDTTAQAASCQEVCFSETVVESDVVVETQ